MSVLGAIALAFSMFSRIPVPQVAWREDNLRYLMCAFPLVGAAIGLVLWGFLLVCGALNLEGLVFAAGITLLPVLVTGGIHLDGFVDVIDALSSRASAQKKREILKDPHIGAFALIGLCSYMIAYFALSSELVAARETVLLVGLMHVLSRVLSGLCTLFFPNHGEAGLLHTFRLNASRRGAAAVLVVLLLLCAGALIALGGATGATMIFAAALCVGCLYGVSARQFDGMSGDLAGWFLQVCELAMLAALVVGGRVWR